jgi:DNA-binding transcriptional regulator YhcF (GntR family)
MIRLWLSREQSIPMREQLSTQLLLGIVSRRLPPGERLPSVRELARRLHIHANTVSAAYRDLAARGWVKQRKGSGVFVRDTGLAAREEGIDGFVHAWLQAGAAQGFTVTQIESALARIAREPPAKEFLVVDPDADLARILALEISEVARLRGALRGLRGVGRTHHEGDEYSGATCSPSAREKGTQSGIICADYCSLHGGSAGRISTA